MKEEERAGTSLTEGENIQWEEGFEHEEWALHVIYELHEALRAFVSGCILGNDFLLEVTRSMIPTEQLKTVILDRMTEFQKQFSVQVGAGMSVTWETG